MKIAGIILIIIGVIALVYKYIPITEDQAGRPARPD